jgi:hypothetical protein
MSYYFMYKSVPGLKLPSVQLKNMESTVVSFLRKKLCVFIDLLPLQIPLVCTVHSLVFGKKHLGAEPLRMVTNSKVSLVHASQAQAQCQKSLHDSELQRLKKKKKAYFAKPQYVGLTAWFHFVNFQPSTK